MSNAKLRTHIGLRVPPSSEQQLRNGIRVGSEVREWVQGEALMFDDSFEHEVWWRSALRNDLEATTLDDRLAQEERVVLVIDVFHPELTVEKRSEIRTQMAAQHASDSPAYTDTKSDPDGSTTTHSVGKSSPVSSWLETAAGSGTRKFELLSGGYRSGDDVIAIVAQSDRAELQVGDRGVVAGPGQVPEKLFVDFGAQRWHLTPDTIKRELEYTADREWQETSQPLTYHSPAANQEVLDENSSSMLVRVLRYDPLILAVDDFISTAEIAVVKRLGLPLLRRSGIQQASATNGSQSDLRTSLTAFLGHKLAFHPTLIAILKRAAVFSGGLPWTHAECMQLISYRQGQRFATHTDYFEFWCDTSPLDCT